MRINDIITESVNEEILDEFSTMDKEIYTSLQQKGYKYLGSGVDQSAFIEPKTGQVLKIFGTDKSNKFSRDHKMFFKWASFCEKHQDNPFLPRFYGHESFMWPLKPDPEGFHDQHRYLMIRTEMLQNSGDIGKALALLAEEMEYSDSLAGAVARFQKDNPKSYKFVIDQLGPKKYAQIIKTMHSLYKMGERNGWGFDLHHGNIMKRRDGTPVLNDPWVV